MEFDLLPQVGKQIVNMHFVILSGGATFSPFISIRMLLLRDKYISIYINIVYNTLYQ